MSPSLLIMKHSLLLVLGILLVGCGGGDEKAAESRTPPDIARQAQDVRVASRPLQVMKYIPQARQEPKAALAAASDEGVALVLNDSDGRDAGSAPTLSPAFGKGYPELKLLLLARTIGDAAPAAPVRPTCKSAEHCEYNLRKTYTVSVDRPTTVRMMARDEGIALVASSLRVLHFETVAVSLTLDRQVVARITITLLPEEAVGAVRAPGPAVSSPTAPPSFKPPALPKF